MCVCVCVCVCVCACVRARARACAQLCPTLWDPVDYSLAGSSVYGIFQARILEGVAISYCDLSGFIVCVSYQDVS